MWQPSVWLIFKSHKLHCQSFPNVPAQVGSALFAFDLMETNLSTELLRRDGEGKAHSLGRAASEDGRGCCRLCCLLAVAKRRLLGNADRPGPSVSLSPERGCGTGLLSASKTRAKVTPSRLPTSRGCGVRSKVGELSSSFTFPVLLPSLFLPSVQCCLFNLSSSSV